MAMDHINGLTLSDDQRDALAGICDRVNNNERVTILGGLGGTGKSILAVGLAEMFPSFAVAAPTNKAAAVLKGRGIARAQTVHSLIRKPAESLPTEDEADELARKLAAKPPEALTPREKAWCKPRFNSHDSVLANGVLVDEASMLDKWLFMDLLALGLPLIFVGDHGQLPPVARSADDPSWSVMKHPTYTLEKVHRNAGDIAFFARHLRDGQSPWGFDKSDGSVEITPVNRFSMEPDENTMALAWSNRRVLEVNKAIRAGFGHYNLSLPVSGGEPVIADWGFDCHDDFVINSSIRIEDTTDTRILRGTRGQILNVEWLNYTANPVLTVAWEGEDVQRVTTISADVRFFKAGKPEYMPAYMEDHTGRKVANKSWAVPIRLGWCTTVHKAQGSEFNEVIVVQDMPRGNADFKAWAYTAASRAKKKLTWLY